MMKIDKVAIGRLPLNFRHLEKRPLHGKDILNTYISGRHSGVGQFFCAKKPLHIDWATIFHSHANMAELLIWRVEVVNAAICEFKSVSQPNPDTALTSENRTY